MIVVFGSLNLDIAVAVDLLPRPGETVLGREVQLSPGGKGANQAHAARLAGAEVRFFGCVGEDRLAEPALEHLRASGVDLAGVAARPGTTGCATIWLTPDGENTIVVASGTNWLVDQQAVPDAALGPGTLLLLQQEVPAEQNWALIARAHAAGARIVMNVAPGGPVPAEALAAVDYLVVNEIESRQVADALGGAPVADDELPDWLAARCGGSVIATHGADGLVCVGPEGRISMAAQPVEPLDTTGAGDTFTGVLAACLDRGLALEAALDHANRAAALSCTRRGTQTAQPAWAEYATAG